MAFARCVSSASHRATMRQPFTLLKALMWSLPRPPTPTIARRTSSFAPSARVLTFARMAAAPTAAELDKNRRRVIRDMVLHLSFSGRNPADLSVAGLYSKRKAHVDQLAL